MNKAAPAEWQRDNEDLLIANSSCVDKSYQGVPLRNGRYHLLDGGKSDPEAWFIILTIRGDVIEKLGGISEIWNTHIPSYFGQEPSLNFKDPSATDCAFYLPRSSTNQQLIAFMDGMDYMLEEEVQ